MTGAADGDMLAFLMRCLVPGLCILALATGCGSSARLFKPDVGADPDAIPRDHDAEACLDSVAPEAETGGGDGAITTRDATPSADMETDNPLLSPDASTLDVPIAEPDASESDAPGTDDVADGGGEGQDARDAAFRDGPNERPRDAPANLVVPELSGTIYSFSFDDTVFAVDAAKGARIVTFSLGGRNLLTAAKDASDINWGATFWPSPQNDWSWPPPAEIDSGAYTASVTGATLTLTSATASALGLSVVKTFTVDDVAGVVNIEYRIDNRGTRSRSVAPWEVSRVAAGGLTFFPMGEGAPSKGSPPLLQLELSEGVAWLAYDPNLITEGQKVLADGSEGWIAHATDNLLFVKAFGDITPAQAAPGEAEVELYADPTHTYIELENQGALTKLAAGASLTWTVRWFLREIDASVSVQTGSADLVGTVRTLVQTP
jgi:hypothetical protein